MAKFLLFWLLVTFLPATVPPVYAQQPGKIPRIGYLTAGSPASIAARTAAFRQGLRELGYVEDKNIQIEWRFTAGDLAKLSAAAAELVQMKLDVIVSGGSTATQPLKAATSTIPIVMTQDPDPVGNGFIASLARPGGNITGLSSLSADLAGKRFDLLKEVVPKLTRVALFGTSSNPGNAQAMKEVTAAAAAAGVKLQHTDVLSAEQIEAAFAAAAKFQADGLIQEIAGTVAAFRRKQITELAVKHRLPAIYIRVEYVDDGGLMTYGVSVDDLDRRAAAYVDKLLKGAKPADLPVEQPKKFHFVVNLKAAKAINLTIPPNVLVRADRVIR